MVDNPVGQNNQKFRLKYWATRLSVHLQRSLVRLLRTTRFARAFRCAHSFARSLTSLTPSLVGQWLIWWQFYQFFSLIWPIVQERFVYFVHADRQRSSSEIKPEFSIPQLITRAILSKADRKMTLHDIYQSLSFLQVSFWVWFWFVRCPFLRVEGSFPLFCPPFLFRSLSIRMHPFLTHFYLGLSFPSSYRIMPNKRPGRFWNWK